MKKTKQISKLRSTPHRQNMLEILNYLKEIFDGSVANHEQPDTTDMPELESEESAEQRRNQQGKGLKILTPNQMLSRLSISLAQLKGGNNSEKLKNEIRQLLYSLYRSKNLQNKSIKFNWHYFKHGNNFYEYWKQQNK